MVNSFSRTRDKLKACYKVHNRCFAVVILSSYTHNLPAQNAICLCASWPKQVVKTVAKTINK